jgi:hypothetical protein
MLVQRRACRRGRSSPGWPELQLAARVGSGAWTPLTAGHNWLPVATTRLDQGCLVAVDVRASFDPRAGNGMEERVEPMAFRVTLTERVPGVSTTGALHSTAASGGRASHAGTGGGGVLRSPVRRRWD